MNQAMIIAEIEAEAEKFYDNWQNGQIHWEQGFCKLNHLDIASVITKEYNALKDVNEKLKLADEKIEQREKQIEMCKNIIKNCIQQIRD